MLYDLPTLCVIDLFNFCLSYVCVLVSYCAFSLYVSNEYYSLICHLYFFGEGFFQVLLLSGRSLL